MSTVQKILTTRNSKIEGFSGYQDPRLPDDYEMPESSNVAVLVDVEVPNTLEEAGSERYYGSADQVLKTVQDDWARVCLNSGRPLLREADSSDFDFAGAAQSAADQYRPGRKGGFTARVTEDEVGQFDDVEELKAFLRRRGAVSTA